MGVSAAIAAVGVMNAKQARDDAKRAEEEQRKRAEEARQRAMEDEKRAREAEVYAETEGKGQGALGEIRTGITETVNTEETRRLRQGKSASALRI